jgi:hypothetical protein
LKNVHFLRIYLHVFFFLPFHQVPQLLLGGKRQCRMRKLPKGFTHDQSGNRTTDLSHCCSTPIPAGPTLDPLPFERQFNEFVISINIALYVAPMLQTQLFKSVSSHSSLSLQASNESASQDPIPQGKFNQPNPPNHLFSSAPINSAHRSKLRKSMLAEDALVEAC